MLDFDTTSSILLSLPAYLLWFGPLFFGLFLGIAHLLIMRAPKQVAAPAPVQSSQHPATA